jgi:O-antigen ligase
MKAEAWQISRSLPGILSAVSRVCWVVFLISLPVTSFPYFPGNFGGGTLVRPLSIYPLLILMVLVIFPRFLTRPLPRTLLAFLPFVLVAVASTFLASLRNIEGLQGVSVTERMLRALATLGLGGSIYLAITLWPESRKDLRFSIRWLYAGFALALIWGTLQTIYVVHFNSDWFELLRTAQRFISTRRLFTNRVSGMTYEPNWFADQIVFILLPWLLAAVLSGTSVFRWRWKFLTIEWLLLAWSVAILPFTFSRAGLLILLVLVVVAVLFFRGKGWGSGESKQGGVSLLLRRALEIVAILAVLAGGIYFAGTRNVFFSRLWDFFQNRPTGGALHYIGDYFEYLGFGARFAYWGTAYRVYEEAPLLGVGLGNYAFYFEEKLPDRPLATVPEVLRLIVPEVGRNRLITAKNLYLRLLAETGLVGTASFLAFIVAIFGCALFLWFSPGPEARFWGIGSLMGMLAFLMVAFSFDSFAVPNMWVVFGFITAAARLIPKEQSVEENIQLI